MRGRVGGTKAALAWGFSWRSDPFLYEITFQDSEEMMFGTLFCICLFA